MSPSIKKLQGLPYGQKVKILWVSTVIIGVVIVIVWTSIMVLVPKQNNENEQAGVLDSVRENVSDAQQQLSNLDNPLVDPTFGETDVPRDYQVITLTEARAYKNNSVRIKFTMNNPTKDLLSVTNTEHSNIYLESDNYKLSPLTMFTVAADPVPTKLLSETTVEGIILFRHPTSSQATLVFENMFFDNQPEAPFTEKFPLTIEKAE